MNWFARFLKHQRYFDLLWSTHICIYLHIYIFIYMPRARMTSIFEGQPPQTMPFPIKIRAIEMNPGDSIRDQTLSHNSLSWSLNSPLSSGHVNSLTGPQKGHFLAELSGHQPLGFQTPNVRRYLDPKKHTQNTFSGCIWKTRDVSMIFVSGRLVHFFPLFLLLLKIWGWTGWQPGEIGSAAAIQIGQCSDWLLHPKGCRKY